MKKFFLFFLLPGAVLVFILILVFSSKTRIKTVKLMAAIYPGLKGIRNNNPGNLRATDGFTWDGQTGTDEKGFCVFNNPDLTDEQNIKKGIRAMEINALRKQEKGINNLWDFGLSWAPPGDNGGATDYGQRLANQLGVGVDDNFDLFNSDPFSLGDLSKAITKNENSINPYPASYFLDDQTLALAYVTARPSVS